MQIYYCRNFKNENKYLLEQYSIGKLTDERRQRMEQLKNKERKMGFLMAEFQTIEILEKIFCIDNPKIYGVAGKKPYVENGPYFNRSYGGEHLILAFHEEKPVGIDLEKITEVYEMVMKYFFTEEEKKYVENAAIPNLAYTTIWTRKESYMKYTGQGMEFQFNMLNTLDYECPTKSYIIDDCIISVAGEKEIIEKVSITEKRNYGKEYYRLF